MLFDSVFSQRLRRTLLVCAFISTLIACGESGDFKSTGEQNNSAKVASEANAQLSSIAEKIPENITITEGLVQLVPINASQRAVLEQLDIRFEEVATGSTDADGVAQRPASLFPVQTTRSSVGVGAKPDVNAIENSNIHFDSEGSYIRLRPAEDLSGQTALKVTLAYNGEVYERLININVKPINKKPVLSTFVPKAKFELADRTTWPILSVNLDPANSDDLPINNPLSMKEDWGLSAAELSGLNASDVPSIDNIDLDDLSGIQQVIMAGGEPFEAIFFLVDANLDEQQAKVTVESKTPDLVRSEDVVVSKSFAQVVIDGQVIRSHHSGDITIPTLNTPIYEFNVIVKPRNNRNSSSNPADDGAQAEANDPDLAETQGRRYAEIHVTVDDGEYQRTSVLYIDVEAINDAPVLGEITDKAVNEDVQQTFSISVTDVDDDISSLTYGLLDYSESLIQSITPAADKKNQLTVTLKENAYTQFDAAQSELENADFGYVDPDVVDTGTLTQLFQNQVSISVEDNEFSSEPQTFRINVKAVNDAPVIIADDDDFSFNEAAWDGFSPQIHVDETLRTLSFTVSDVDNALDDLEVSELNDSRNKRLFKLPPVQRPLVGSDKVEFLFTPTNFDVFGTSTFKVKVSDAANKSSSALTTVTINPANDRPTLGPISPIVINERGSKKAIIDLFDIETLDGQMLPFELDVSNIKRVGDSLNLSDEYDATNLIKSIYTNSANTRIIVEANSLPNNSLAAMVEYDIAVSFRDLGALNMGGGDLTVPTPQNLRITLVNVNDKPTVSVPVNVFTLSEDDTPVTVNFTPDDPDFGNALEYRVLSSRTAVIKSPVPTFTPLTDGIERSFDFVMEPDKSGDVVLTLRVKDQDGLFVDHKINVAVEEVNDTPVLDPIADRDVNEGKVIVVPFKVLDNSLTGSVTETTIANLTVDVENNGGPSGLLGNLISNIEVINNNRALRITTSSFPANASASSADYVFTVEVSDDGKSNDGLTDIITVQDSFTLTINDINQAPTLSVPVDVFTPSEDDTPVTVNFTPDDPDFGNALEYRVLSSRTAVIKSPVPTFTPLNDEEETSFDFVMEPDKSGDVVLTLRVKDQNGLFVDHKINVAVDEVNDAPTLEDIADDTIDEGKVITIPFTALDTSLSGTVLETAKANLDITAVAISSPSAPLDNLIASIEVVNANQALRITTNNFPSGAPSASATYRFEISVADDGKNNDNVLPIVVTKSFNLTINDVNEKPGFSVLPPALENISEDAGDQTVNFTPDDPDPGNSLAYKVLSSNDGLIADPEPNYIALTDDVAHAFTYKPIADKSGSAVLTLRLKDQGGLTFDHTIDVTVAEINDVPRIDTPLTNQVINERSSIVIPLDLNDNSDSQSVLETARQNLVLTATSSTSEGAVYANVITDANIITQGGNKKLKISAAQLPIGGMLESVNYTIDVSFEDLGTNDNGDDKKTTGVNSFTVQVNNVNDAPTIDSLDATSLASLTEEKVEAESLSPNIGFPVIFKVNDIDPNENLTYTITSNNQSLISNSSLPNGLAMTGPYPAEITYYVQPILGTSGTARLTLAVTDGEKTVRSTFDVLVAESNDAPTIDAFDSNLSAPENTSTFVKINNWQDDNTPRNRLNFVGTPEVTVVSGQLAASSAEMIDLLDPSLITFDGAKNNIILQLGNFPQSADPLGVLYKVSFQLSDNGVSNLGVLPFLSTDEVSFNILVTDANTKPSIENLITAMPIILNEDDGDELGTNPFSEDQLIEIRLVDPDPAEILTVTITSSNTNLFEDPKGSGNYEPGDTVPIAYRPKLNAFGTSTIKVVVSDGELSETLNIPVTVDAVNDKHKFNPTPPDVTTIDEDDNFIIPFEIFDIETTQSAFTYTITSSNEALIDPADLKFTSGKQALSIKPKADANGTAKIVLTVSDGDTDNDITDTFTLSVNPINDAPVISGLSSSYSIKEGDGEQAYAFSVTDVDDTQGTTYTVTSNNTEIIADVNIVKVADGMQQEAELRFNLVNDNAYGTVKLTVTATDNNTEDDPAGSKQAVKVVTINVTAVNDAPTLEPVNNLAMNEDESALLAIALGDVELDINELIVAAEVITTTNLQLISASGITTDGSKANLIVTPNSNQSGVAQIKVSVSDNDLTAPEQIFTLTVNAVNDAPVIKKILGITHTTDQTAIIEPEYNDYRGSGNKKPVISFEVSDADALDGTNDPADIYSNISIKVNGDFIDQETLLIDSGSATDDDEIALELSFNDISYGLGVLRFLATDSEDNAETPFDVDVALYKLIEQRTINDTGLTDEDCADEAGNGISCLSLDVNPALQRQDANLVTNSMQFNQFTATTCIEDVNQGLIWANDDKAHTAADVNSTVLSQVELEDYINSANEEAVCGISTWRLPSLDELSGIVDYSKDSAPLINDDFSATDVTDKYWTQTRHRSSKNWWQVSFDDGRYYRSVSPAHVRLVSDQP